MNATNPAIALVLFAHGSSRPEWRAPLDSLRTWTQEEVAAHVQVHLAFLERTRPTLLEVVAGAVAAGAAAIEILPMFISGGGHVERDLPPLMAALQAAHPGLPVKLHPAIGEHPAIVTAIAGLVGNNETPSAS